MATTLTELEKSTEMAVDNNFILRSDKEIIDSAKDNLKDYRVMKRIGSGMFSKVFLIQHLDGTKYILKLIDQDNIEEDEYKMFNTELEIYNYLSKKYGDKCEELGLLCLKDYFKINHNLSNYHMIILNNYGDSDLSIYLKNKNLNIYEKELIIFHLCKNLKLLHDNGISHKDIKPDNIRIDSKTKKAYLIDYGFACLDKLKDFKICRDAKYGSPLYSSPELNHYSDLANRYSDKYNKDIYSKSIDLWSLGLLFYDLLNDNELYVTCLNNTFSSPDKTQNQKLIDNWYFDKLYKKNISNKGLEIFKELILSLINNPNYRGGIFSRIFVNQKLMNQKSIISKYSKQFMLDEEIIDTLFSEFNDEIKKYNLENLLFLDPEGRDLNAFMLSRAAWLQDIIKDDASAGLVNFDNIKYKKLSDEHKAGIRELVQEYKNEFVDNMEFTEDNVDDVLRASKKMSQALRNSKYQNQNEQFKTIKAFKDILSTQTNTGKKLKEKIDIFAGKLKSIFSFTQTRSITKPETSVMDLTYLRNNPPSNAPPRLPYIRRSTRKSTLSSPPSRPAPKRTQKVSSSQPRAYTYSQTSSKTKKSRHLPPSRAPPTFRPTPRPRPAHTFGKGKKKKNFLKKSLIKKSQKSVSKNKNKKKKKQKKK